MGDMTDVFNGVVNITGNLLDSDFVNRFTMAIFAVILVFGILNCVFGYRLLRFWMMIGTYNGNAGEIHDADRSFGNRCCVCGNRIFDL